MPKQLDHDKIKQLIKEGNTADEIAWQVGGQVGTIRILARKWRIKIKRHSQSGEGRYNTDTIDYLDSIRNPKPKVRLQNEGLSSAGSNFVEAI